MRVTVLFEEEREGRRIWRTIGGYVVEGFPVRVDGDEHATAVLRLLDLAERGVPAIRPVAETALERVRNAGADPRLMVALIDRAIDGALHGHGPLEALRLGVGSAA